MVWDRHGLADFCVITPCAMEVFIPHEDAYIIIDLMGGLEQSKHSWVWGAFVILSNRS